MTKLGTIDFDNRVLDALRDEQLVIFAGAGVSMGPPSNLASFWTLACNIAKGTGFSASGEPLDRFLGKLQHRNIAVHERAAQLLSPAESAPNELHHSLLRLFRTADRIRLVTTNFDRHFETAAKVLFGAVPDLYFAPALPLGQDFSGIVHVHGALPRARDLVLTDADFGRAYLTEGWARRFLVDVFRRYTVLFVGYSHNDVVMNYLARALPVGSIADRFALTDEAGSWKLLGIKPIHFTKRPDANPFQELYDGVRQLAERATRGALDWQSRLSELGNRAPPTDEEALSEVEQALREVHTTRFLLNVARDPEWLRWLDERKYLKGLFGHAELSELEHLLVDWLAQHFSIEHPDAVLEIMAAHGLRMNPVLWWAIGRELGVMTSKRLEEDALKRWISILLASAPERPDRHVLMWLAERCACQGSIELTLKLFMSMSEYQLEIKPSFRWPVDEVDSRRRLQAECTLRGDYWSLDEVWIKHLKPAISHVAMPLLSGLAWRLEEIHAELTAWGKASREWDPVSYGRSAIEQHEQDQYPKAVDVLINAIRDALEWISESSPALLSAWIERLVVSNSPLLRRLAIHAIGVHPELSPEGRLEWLLNRVGLHGASEHHEVHRVVAQSYAGASDQARRSVVEAIMAIALPATDDWSAEKRTARWHFDWLSWLLQAKSDCAMARSALAPIEEQHPDWLPSDHPDLTHWMGSGDWVGSESPWSVDQLLARAPAGQLAELVDFKGTTFDGPSRDGLLTNLCEACKQSTSWAFALAEAIADLELWKSDLWPALVQGLRESNLNLHAWQQILTLAANPVLQSTYPHEISNLLFALVTRAEKPLAIDLLMEANALSFSVWQALEKVGTIERPNNWLSSASSPATGLIVEFWIKGLSLLVHGKTDVERVMPEPYRQWFNLVIQDATSRGMVGRRILASHTYFLFGLDDKWVRQNILPLFLCQDRERFGEAWEGYLTSGRLNPALAEALLPAVMTALPRLADLQNRRQRFIEFYTALAVFHVSDPAQEMLPTLFQYGSLEDRLAFASHLGYVLRKMQQPAKKQLWDSWLRRYWEDRLQGVLAPLDQAEILKMLEWLPYLGDTFPDAVTLAIRSKSTQLEHSHVLYEFRNSDLVNRFPVQTAELLIYLANCSIGYHARDLALVYARLPALAAELRGRVDEAFARAGVPTDRE